MGGWRRGRTTLGIGGPSNHLAGARNVRVMTRAIVVCGAQKSCSTSFAAALSDHERVVIHSVECLSLERCGLSERRLGLRAQRLSSGPTSLCVKRPEYLHLPELGRRAAVVFVDAIAVVILREPVSRFQSAFHHYRRLGLLDDPSPIAYLNRWMHHQHPCQDVRCQPGSFSFYGKSLESLLESFNGRVEIFFQDEILEDPNKCLNTVWQSAGLEADVIDHERVLPRLNVGLLSRAPNRLGMIGSTLGVRESRFGSILPRRRPLQTLGAAILALSQARRTTTADLAGPSSVADEFWGLLRADFALIEGLVGRSVPANWLMPEMLELD